MRDYGLDGAWLQHFLVGLPGGPEEAAYPSRFRVLGHVRAAARQTGRVWALSYEIAGMQLDRIFDVLTTDWKKMVEVRSWRTRVTCTRATGQPCKSGASTLTTRMIP